MRWGRLLWWTTAVIFFTIFFIMLSALQDQGMPMVAVRFILLALVATVPAIFFALWEGWRCG